MTPKETNDPYGLAGSIANAEALRDRLRQLRDDLGRIRGAAVSDFEWENLKAWHRKEGIDAVPISELLDDLDNLPPAPGQTPQPRPIDRHDPKQGTTRAGALSALMALEAGQRDDVKAWRQRAQLDSLLPFDDALGAWLQERAATQPGDVELLDYATPSATHVQRIAITCGSLLDDLRILADDLASIYRWSPYGAVLFVLAGIVPIVPAVRSTVTVSTSASASCIRLEIDPYTDPKRVAAVYAEVRNEAAPGKRFRLPEQRALDVVEYVARFHDGEPSPDALKGWNAEMKKRKQPEWRYDDLEKFRRKYEEAVEKVLDPKFF